MQLGVTARGSGLDHTGASIGSGMIISTAKLTRIKEIDPRQRLVRIEAGVKIGELNKALALHNLTVPVSADPEHTIGGLIANAHTGPMSGKYGSLLRYVEQLEAVLSSGEIIHTESLGKRKLRKKQKGDTLEAAIYRDLSQLIADNPGLVELMQSPSVGQTGYRGVSRVKYGSRFDLLPAFFGSQGTLGVVTEVIMRTEYISDPPLYITAAFEVLEDAMRFASRAKAINASRIDLYDIDIFNIAAANSKPLRILNKRPDSGFIVLVALDDHSNGSRKRKLKKLRHELSYAVDWASDSAKDYDHQLEISAILESYLNTTSRRVRLPFLDGVSIPVDRLADYLSGLVNLSTKHRVALTGYGSVATNIYNVRPEIDITTVDGRKNTLSLLHDYSELVISLGGSLTGSSPEGRLKSIYALADDLNPELAEFNRAVKSIFDPRSILNLGVKVDVNPRATVRELRVTPDCGIITP